MIRSWRPSQFTVFAIAFLVFWVRWSVGTTVSAQTPVAQKDRWIVIPSTVGETGNPGHLARKAAKLLEASLDAHGRRMLGREEARRLFEQRGSAPPMQATASDIDALARDAQQALYHVASGLYTRAQNDVARVMSRARGALESINRESRAARHLLDACMYLVRGHLGRNDRTQARRQALECRRLVPDIQPDSTMHPPDVIGVLAEAEAELLNREPSSLRIESDPMGCAALVNGRNLGTTPKELPRLSPGEYRVQVECHDGEPGRVHRAMLSSNRVVARVDTRFDGAIQTAFDLSLRYSIPSDEYDHAAHDALEAARTVGAGDLVLVRLASEAALPVVEATRVRVDDGAQVVVARITFDVSGDASQSAVEAAAKALMEAKAPPRAVAEAEPAAIEGPSVQPAKTSGSAPIEHTANRSVQDEPTRRDATSGAKIAGLAAAGVGAAADLAGWALYLRLASLQSDYSRKLRTKATDRFDAYRDVEAADLAPKLTLGGGAAVLSASMPFWLPEQDSVPWWAWTAGGVGVVSAGVGLKLAFDADTCERDELGRCTQPELGTQLGTQLLLQAVPLVTLPIVYAVRSLTGGSDATIGLNVQPTAVSLRYTQTL